MLSVLLSIGIFILVLSFLVIIHELGHFFAARYAGIKVREFGVGYPPRAIKLFTWLNSEFTLNWIPFGGFVRMEGEEADPEERKKQHSKGEFYAASVPHRLLVILAGAAINFIFGIFSFAAIFSFIGIPEELRDARIGYVAPESPAALAGVPTQVSIVGFRESPNSDLDLTGSAEAVIEYVQNHRGQTVEMVTSGNCQGKECQEMAVIYQVYLRTAEETPADQGSLGIGFESVAFVKYPWWEMPWRGTVYGLQESMALGREILRALSKLGTDLVQKGQVSAELSGPVGIVHQAHSAGILNQGFIMVLSFAGMLSINLAIMNVLPIPPLDGGKALFTVLETVVHRKYLYKAEYWLSYGGYFLLMALIIFITVRDVWQLFA